MAQRPISKRTVAVAGQAPAHHGRLDGAAGFVVAPFATDEAAGGRKLIGAAVVLAKHLNRLIRRRFALSLEFGQTSFARCHFPISPERDAQSPRSRSALLSRPPALTGLLIRKPHARMRF